MAFVYLLGTSRQDNVYKIGMTRGDIEKRIKQLQTGNDEEIYMLNSFKTKYPFFIERSLHLKFCPKNKRNEWFELEIEDVGKFKEYCTLFEENAKALEDNSFTKNILK